MKLYLIKIGGSVCTAKQKNKAKVQRGIVKQICSELTNAGIGQTFNAIIVHGAGSFGHSLVKHHRVNDGVKTEKQLAAARKIQQSVYGLNKEIVALLREENIFAVGIKPHEICMQKNKRLISVNLAPIKKALQCGLVPVLYGDMVPDETLGLSVMSGDALMPWLAVKFKPTAAFYGTDVAGVYSADPIKNRKAKLIMHVTRANYLRLLKKATGSSAIDVTGGMRGKLEKLSEIPPGVLTIIFDARLKSNWRKLFAGTLEKCTVVQLYCAILI